MYLITILATLLVLSEQCQEIQMIAEDGNVIVSRSMEFAQIDAYVVAEPRDLEHVMPDLPNCEEPFRFSNRYKSVKLRWNYGDSWSNADSDGMNSAGVSASALYFPNFSYFPDRDSLTEEHCHNTIPHLRVGKYVLAMFGSVQEIRDALNNGTFPEVYAEEEEGMVHPIHYQFADKTGEAVILEYTKERGRQVYNNTVGVFTNSPNYDWHMENLRNYPQLRPQNWGEVYGMKSNGGSGTSGMPGDYSSPSRFIKAATLLRHVNKPQTKNEALMQSFHLMNAADIPQGIVLFGSHSEDEEEKQSKDSNKKDKKNKKNKKDKKAKSRSTRAAREDVDTYDQTSWVAVKSLTEGCLYYRGYSDISIRRVCLHSTSDDRTMVLPVDGKWKNSYKDVTNDMEEWEGQY